MHQKAGCKPSSRVHHCAPAADAPISSHHHSNHVSNFHIIAFLNACFFLLLDGVRTATPGSTKTSSPGKVPSQHGAPHRHEPYKRARSAKSNASAAKGTKNGKDSGSVPTNKPKKPPKAVSGDVRLLACPCYKHNPIAHMMCLLRNSLTETCFVVQHLERSHPKQPIHCPVCGRTFDTRTDCNDHIGRRLCEPRTFQHPGFTDDQLRGLRQPRRNLNEAERWYCLWDILYPGKPRPASPYVGSPFEEMMNIARRAYQAARDNIFDFNPVVRILTSQPYNQINNTGAAVESQLFDWPHVMSIIPTDEDDLSYLTSDSPNYFGLPQFINFNFPGSAVVGANATQPPNHPFSEVHHVPHMPTTDNGSWMMDTYPSFNDQPLTNLSDPIPSPSFAFLDLGLSNTQLTENTSSLSNNGIRPDNHNVGDAGDDDDLQPP
ncbi:hypothetical protein B0H63DRAFT_523972 [Podospora didyma]|uniref:C2H2-type domain-containing protein n=1 Tax=Podospora didyma TaxID=330526 RepID=A0AAE0NGV7_9PEZI|nr:hypothetical protein B0H63DRAFT_523972 [Podospora didyma]